jgi:murein DD-endopeptidase MepM/ murein hydrolase activator NlpD
LISSVQAAFGRARHFWIEGAAGVALTLGLVDAAGASLPPPSPVKVAVAPTPATVEAPAPKAAPVFACGEPVPGHEVDSPYGLRRLPWERQGRLHEGVDIAAPLGAPVMAVADGVVLRKGDSPSYGRFVEVRHAGSGLTSFYAHLGRIDRTAMVGAQISKGSLLGRIGSSGTSTGPHLHFEIRRDGKALNPASFLDHEFATTADLPIKAASYVSPHVRVAAVSEIPASKLALMDAGGRHGRRAHRSYAAVEVADAGE